MGHIFNRRAEPPPPPKSWTAHVVDPAIERENAKLQQRLDSLVEQLEIAVKRLEEDIQGTRRGDDA